MTNGSEFGEVPGKMGPPIEGAKGAGGEMERRLLEERGREQVAFLTELLKDSTTSPDVGTALVRGEFLLPTEKGGMDISNFEAEPLLKELLRRSGAPILREQLAEILARQKEKARGEIGDIEETIRGAKETGLSDEALKGLIGRLDSARKAEKTERILRFRIGEELPEEAEKWLDLFKETKARIRLEQSWKQRVTAATSSTGMFAEQLFNAPFTAVYPTPSELATIFSIPEIGEAADLALETYLDIHLDREGLTDEEKKKLKILQEKDSIPENQSTIAGYIKEHCGNNKPWVQESAEILARHYLEFDLTSNWLATPRDKDGNIDYPKAIKKDSGDTKIGFGLLEGDTQPMGSIWLILTRLKYLSELSKDRPVGPPALAPAIPEYLSEPLLRFMKVNVNKEGQPVHLNDVPKTEKERKRLGIEKKPILEGWYFANKRKEEEIWERVKRSEITEDAAREEYRKTRIPLAKFLECVSDGEITYWAYCIFRQSLVRSALVKGAGSERERDEMLVELWMPEALRGLGKSFQVAFGERVLERELTKVNLIASRILIWTDKLFAPPKIRKRNLEVTREDQKSQEIREADRFAKIVKKACRISGFLNETSWRLVEEVMRERQALIPSDLAPEQLSALLRQGETPPLERATGKTLADVTKEMKETSARMASVQRKIEEKRREIEAKEGKKRNLTLIELREVFHSVLP